MSAGSTAKLAKSVLFDGNIAETVKVGSADSYGEPECSVQLVITSPPDLSETRCSSWDNLFALYDRVFVRCVKCLARGGVITVIVTDRKWRGTIVWKHEKLRAILERNGMTLFLHKVLIRRRAADLYRFGFSHVMCFKRRSQPTTQSAARRSTMFLKDVWGPYHRQPGLPLGRNSFAPQAIALLVEAFTKPGDLVLDPFCGAGVTQRVALALQRRSKGYEIDPRLSRFWRSLR